MLSDKQIACLTDRMMSLIESGTIPWRRPWSAAERPLSGATGKPYQGWNFVSLLFEARLAGYVSPYWFTRHGAKKLGENARVPYGLDGIAIVSMREGRKEVVKDGETEVKHYRYATLDWVYNFEQIEGVDPVLGAAYAAGNPDAVAHQEADALVAAYATCPTIEYGGDRAAYLPADDVVLMPLRRQFDSTSVYYATLFHELVHSTGHRSRLARPNVTDPTRFDAHHYACEELVAEWGATMLLSACGLTDERAESNQAAYLSGWLKVLKQDKRLLVDSVTQATEAYRYITGEMTRPAVEGAAA